MYRVLLPAVLSLSLAGCGMASYSFTSGFANSGQPSPRTAQPRNRQRRSADQARTAKADDKAPKGTFEKAPAGALSDRDYSHTRLDAERARELVNAYRKEKGLRPLKLQPALTEAARAHSQRSRQVGPHLALRLGRLQSLGSGQARRLQRQAGGGERRHRPGQLRRGHEGLAGKPRAQQEPAAARCRAHGDRAGAGSQDRVQDLLDAGDRLAALRRRLAGCLAPNGDHAVCARMKQLAKRLP